jgi:hypothetical protein
LSDDLCDGNGRRNALLVCLGWTIFLNLAKYYAGHNSETLRDSDTRGDNRGNVSAAESACRLGVARIGQRPIEIIVITVTFRYAKGH